MCHFLYVATPLTLSELRSMLPTGLAADLLPPAEHAVLLPLLAGARTAARLLAGACSCDLYLARDPKGHSEEAELRRRYRELGVTRDLRIRALDRHRRHGTVLRHPMEWARLVTAFVAEHARNAGPTLYYREVAAEGMRGPARPPEPIPLARVLELPSAWLPEGVPVVVIRQ
ncbi:MAG TPA: hypothetical protein VF037_07720 [Gemmatimonadales bacterium]